MASRRLQDLHPALRPLAAQFLMECDNQLPENTRVFTTCTYRSPEEQEELYAIGRTKPGRKVTWTLNSKHNHREDGQPAALAIDVAILRNGKLVWKTSGEEGKLWRKIGAIGESFGLTWGGRWKNTPDFSHFEIEVHV